MSPLHDRLLPVTHLLLAVLSAAAEPPKPIALVGNSYGRHERKHLREEILFPKRLVFEEFDGWMPIERLDDFGLVVYCTSVERPLTEQESQAVGEYLKGGGQVLFVNLASYRLSPRMADATPLPWVGARSIRWSQGGEPEVRVFGKDPVVAHVRKDTLYAVAPLGVMATGVTTMQPLIAGRKGIVVGVNRVGKGALWFCGPETFRLKNSADSSKKRRQLYRNAHADIVSLIGKIVLQANPETRSDQISQGVEGLPDPVLWYRDPGETARGAEYLKPCFPKADEVLKHIHLDAGQNEWESFRVHVTCLRPQPQLRVQVSDLKGPGDARIPGKSVTVRIQGLADEKLIRVGTYWLLDGEAEEGDLLFNVPATASRTFWFTLNTHGRPPGEYRGAIVFSPGRELPLHLKVWPVPLPPKAYFDASATTHWTSLPGGNYRKETNFDEYEKYIADMGEHHISFDCPAGHVMWGRSWVLERAVLRSDGTPLPQAIRERPELFQSDELPRLDLSHFDSYPEIAARHGLTQIRIPYLNRDAEYIGYTQDITGSKSVDPGSDRHTAIRHWCMNEFLRYFRERGYRSIGGTIADEQPPEKIPDMVKRGSDMLRHGWRVSTTITGMTGRKAEHYQALDPALNDWILNLTILDDFWREFAAHPDLVGRDDLIGTYVADWHRAAYAFNRKYGWLGPFFRLDRWFVHGYLRWYSNGGAIWPGPSGPVATEGWEGVRDGIEDGRMFAQLLRLLATLERSPAKGEAALSTTISDAKEDLRRLVSFSEESLIPLLRDDDRHGSDLIRAVGRESQMREAKRFVLKHLARLRTYWDFEHASLRWGNTVIAQHGKPNVTIVPGRHANLAKELAARLTEMSGHAFHIGDSPQDGLIPVYLGSLETNPGLAAAANEKSLGVNGRYPAPGRYLFLEFTTPEGTAIALYAVDEAGLKRAIELWPQFLDADHGLLPYDRTAFAKSFAQLCPKQEN